MMQLYVIRAPLGTTCISCVYALLPAKSETVYTEMLEAVTDACSALGVNADDVAKHFVGMVDGLAQLPLADVLAGGGTSSRQHPPASGRRDRLLRRDVRHWTTPRRAAANATTPLPPARIRRQPPLFTPDVWSVHVTTVTGANRTNNMCESWNSAFQRLVRHQHPGCGRCSRKDATLVSTLIVQKSCGMSPHKRQKRVYVHLQARLTYMCDARAAGTKSFEELLDGVGHLIQF